MNSANNNEALVRAFFDTWSVSFESMIEGFQRFVADDCLLIQTRTPDLHGLGEIIRAGLLVERAAVVDLLAGR